jgi:hypothetical protein
MPNPETQIASGERHAKHRYRVRRGLFGKSILQRLNLCAVPVGGSVMSKQWVWEDVPYCRAPRALTTSIED